MARNPQDWHSRPRPRKPIDWDMCFSLGCAGLVIASLLSMVTVIVYILYQIGNWIGAQV